MTAAPGSTYGPGISAAGGPTILGDGAQFAAPEVAQWVTDVARQPYDLSINFTPRSSRDARYDFTQGTEDFAVSDIRYQPYPYDTAAPAAGTFIYLPVTAGGLAFMYNLPGVSGLQLSSYSACALLSGAVAFWDDPVVEADNPGVALPHVKVTPVIDSDAAGTNYVLEEYCLADQPALWAAFVASALSYSTGVGVSDIFPTQPSSDWPRFPAGVFTSGSSSQADTVAAPQSTGYITAVETSYAIQRHTPVASVKNATGIYVQPSDVAVASALAYAVQQPDGTHVLNFAGLGPHVYNPSTYSYVLAPTAGFNPAKGAVLGAFLDYDLTLGQQQAPGIGYASLGLSLERQGVDRLQAVPGDPALTAAEQAGYACGDLTPTDVAAGVTSPTCGAVNPNTAPLPGTPPTSAAPPPSPVQGTATGTGATAPVVQKLGAAAAAAGPIAAGGVAAIGGYGDPGASTAGSALGVGAVASATARTSPSPGLALAPLPATDPDAGSPATFTLLGATGADLRWALATGLLLMLGGSAARRRARRART